MTHSPTRGSLGALRWTTIRPALTCALALTLAHNSAQAFQQEVLTPYDLVDRVEGAQVKLATFPVRPMLLDPNGTIWAVNHHDSRVNKIDPSGGVQASYATPWDPVSVAWWPGDGTAQHPAELLVVCRGSWSVVGIDPTTGDITRNIQLRDGDVVNGAPIGRIGLMAEPGDILVDEDTNMAFVSCTGGDSVLQIDLVTSQVVRVFDEVRDPNFQIKSPLFLSFQDNGEGVRKVLVAPLHSGNNTVADSRFSVGTQVVSLDAAAPDRQLPDNDLFQISPYESGGTTGSVKAVAKRTGAVLFAQGIHPSTQDFWQLNTEANNDDPDRQNEPSVNGRFVHNRVTVIATPGINWTYNPGTDVSIERLDPFDPDAQDGNTQISTANGNAVGQPYGLAFEPADVGDHAFATGLLTDNVVVLDSTGKYSFEWDVEEGGIPRQILLRQVGIRRYAHVYNWGTNTLQTFRYGRLGQPGAYATEVSSYSLGEDMTPHIVQVGRKMFYDGANSHPDLAQNLSCASCHVEGGSDMLAWNLSGIPVEEKGPMVTQTLVGIERVGPFHWRGERNMADFNHFAFPGLLGGESLGTQTNLPNEEFTGLKAFEAFVFSLNNPANPNQHKERKLSNLIHFDPAVTGDAARGQMRFQDRVDPIFSPLATGPTGVQHFACADCHSLPLGTGGGHNPEQRSVFPKRSMMKPAPFHELWRKKQSSVKIMRPNQTEFTDEAFLGQGLIHSGDFQDIPDFMDGIIRDDNGPDGTVDTVKNVSDFLHQADQGLGNGVHFTHLFKSGAATTEVDYLWNQMLARNLDIAVVGKVWDTNGTVLLEHRWFSDRHAPGGPTFMSDERQPRALDEFKNAAVGESNLFIGMPVGTAERFAVDYDMDGVYNKEPDARPYEIGPTLPTTAPAFLVDPAELWTTINSTRITFTTDQPAIARVSATEQGTGRVFTGESDGYSREHSILVTDLRGSTARSSHAPGTSVMEFYRDIVVYNVSVELEGVGGMIRMPAVDPSLTIQTKPLIDPTDDPNFYTDEFLAVQLREHIVIKNHLELADLGGGIVEGTVDLTVAFKRGRWEPTTPPLPGNPRAANRIVVGRLLVKKSDGRVRVAEEMGLPLTSSPGTGIVSYVTTNFLGSFGPPTADPLVQTLSGIPLWTPVGSPNPKAGPLIYSTELTNANGETQLKFQVDSRSSHIPAPLDDHFVAGDSLIFSVEAVLEVDPSLSMNVHTVPVTIGSDEELIPGTYGRLVVPVLFPRVFTQWSFPDTKEMLTTVEALRP